MSWLTLAIVLESAPALTIDAAFGYSRGKMAVHIRLARHGTRKAPFFRVVVTDQRSARNGRFIEHIGLFDPRSPNATLSLNRERYEYWTQRGALPSATVTRLAKEAAAKSV